MTVKEFVRRCMSENLPAHIYDADAQDDSSALIVRIDRLADIAGLAIENREVEIFSVVRNNDGSVYWSIVLGK